MECDRTPLEEVAQFLLIVGVGFDGVDMCAVGQTFGEAQSRVACERPHFEDSERTDHAGEHHQHAALDVVGAHTRVEPVHVGVAVKLFQFRRLGRDM